MNSIATHKCYSIAKCGLAILACTLGSSRALAQTPVAHWTFDDGIDNYEMTTVEDIVNSNDAVWQDLDGEMNFDTSGLSYGAGQIGAAVRLGGGTNQYFLVESVPQISGIVPTPPFGEGDPVLGVGVTWSAWMYVDESVSSSNKGVFTSRTVTDDIGSGPDDGENWAMNWEGGDHIDARVSGQAVDSPADSIGRNQWHHLVMVWGNVDENAVVIPPAQRLYIDGALVAEDDNTDVFEMVDSGSWLIGEDSCCNGREFEGLLDDFAIFDSALSTAQVQTLYNNGLSGINASGIATEAIVTGDVDGGGVSLSDFEIIRDNLGKNVNARSLGDLTGNGKVELDDFQQWLEVAPAAMRAEALASFSVPEPSSVLLVGAAVAVAFWGRRRGRISAASVHHN
ncbi:PEP-CTERM sorting domain-containing protein [Aeoliella sp. ICT_H6.2]|uniref:PEP-CTERM sorting domain-containing protein n=1 Tax=Aeoliella straminimaris TaxID=2954799 RepID=A0A9X2FEB9_9BACT|nr:LamG-like jellyroll fold domain-containing protein [Aeoliella straminimaris]MCO6047460.1 PEP-CTERM sorting domain-containing protein [Aeoliella straminimaris]